MINTLTKEVKKLRKDKGLSQNDVADKWPMPRSTYAKKEKDGDFTYDDVPIIVKLLGGNRELLLDLIKQNTKVVVDNWQEYLIKNAINNNAAQRVILMALSEVLAKQRGESVTKVLSELTGAVEAERGSHSLR